MESELNDKELREAQRCNYGNGEFALAARGVYYLGKDKDGNALPPQWLCSRLEVTAKTRDEHGNEWGRLLEWQDDDSLLHQWSVPLQSLEGDGIEVRRELAGQGLHITHSRNRDLVCAYIKAWYVEARARCVNRLGWHGPVYVCADHVVGESAERYIYQNANAIKSAMQVSGTLDEWRQHIAALAQGNTRLILVVCTALAAPLVRLAGEEAGGFHLRGKSSCGKSTALQVAASVWGKPVEYIRSWHSTSSALEGQACLHNDGLLILDEIGQVNPEEVGEAAYLLANGQGKGRATKFGTARLSLQWLLLFLSAGEVSLADLMTQGRKRTTAGQEIRLADVPADAGAGLGLFDVLHGFSEPGAMAQALKQSAARFHGSVGQAWLEYLSKHLDGLRDYLQAHINRFATAVTPKEADGQVQRVARRFGLLAAAGELASQIGLTGWPQGAADAAVQTCFMAWLDNFGGAGSHEERAIIRQTLAFLETQGSSRYERLDAEFRANIPNRAGYWRGPEEQPEFLTLSNVFRSEICKGFNEKLVKHTLIAAGILQPGTDGRPTQLIRPRGLGPTRAYALRYDSQSD